MQQTIKNTKSSNNNESDAWLEELLATKTSKSAFDDLIASPSQNETSSAEGFNFIQIENVQKIRKKAFACYNQGNYQEALDTIEDAIRILPGDMELNYFQAQCLFQLGELSRVEVILRDLLTLDESNGFRQLPRMLAFTLLKEEKFAEAENFLSSLIISLPDDLQLRHMYGYALERQKKWADAEKIFSEILSQEPEHENANNSLAYVLYLQGKDLEQASLHIQKALVHSPNNPAYLDTYGMIMHARGDQSSAQQALKNALQADPHNKTILAHLNQVLQIDSK